MSTDTTPASTEFYNLDDVVEITAPGHTGKVFKVINYSRSDRYPYVVEDETGLQLKVNPRIMRRTDRPFSGVERASLNLGTVVRFTNPTSKGKAGLFVVIKPGGQPYTYNLTVLGGADGNRYWRSVDSKNLTVVALADLGAEIAKG